MDLTASIYGLYALLEEFPEDWDSYQVLADALEEDGSPLAAGYRWLGRARRRPYPPNYHDDTWTWHKANTDDFGYLPSDLPETVWHMLLQRHQAIDNWYLEFRLLRDALDAAAQAYLDACAAGWKEEVSVEQ